MGCNDKISNICVESKDSKCIDYTGDKGNNSKIEGGCITQHEVNQDVYKILDEVIEGNNLSQKESSCITYVETRGKVLPKTVMERHREEICSLKAKITELEDKKLADIDITDMGLDFKCLTSICGEPITKMGDLLQAIINRACHSITNQS